MLVFLEESREERVVGEFSSLDAVELVAEVSGHFVTEHFVQELLQIVLLQVRLKARSAEENVGNES